MKWMNRSWIFNLWQIQEPDWIMWGTAQVMFVNNPLSGLLVTAALFLQHPQWALGGLLANIVSTVSAVLLKENRSADISVKQLSLSSLGLHFLRLSYCSNSIFRSSWRYTLKPYHWVYMATVELLLAYAEGIWYWWLFLPNVFVSILW